MIYLLILHISLGALLVLSFVIRFVAVITKRINPKTGRHFVEGLGFALVSSGVALVFVAKAPLTGACLSSLTIIFTIIALEYGLSFAKPKTLLDK